MDMDIAAVTEPYAHSVLRALGLCTMGPAIAYLRDLAQANPLINQPNNTQIALKMC